MIIAVDAMGGDYAPKEIVAGAEWALKEIAVIEGICLVGDEVQIKGHLSAQDDRIEIIHTDEWIEMGEHPATAYRSKKQASITLATKLVREGRADAVISAGSTGAQMVAALFELGRIKGIKRPAIGVLLPSLKGHKLLVDAGANTEVDSNNLLQFAIMGHEYMKQQLPTQKPTVGLINNGAEEGKGSALTQEAHQLLKMSDQIDFYGNIEGRDITAGVVDVMVCDGFTGNVVLKTLEGFGKGIFSMLKDTMQTSLRYQLGAMLLKPALYALKAELDPKKVGGAPLLGVRGISIVCHGNSDREAIFHGIKVASECVENKLIEHIETAITHG